MILPLHFIRSLIFRHNVRFAPWIGTDGNYAETRDAIKPNTTNLISEANLYDLISNFALSVDSICLEKEQKLLEFLHAGTSNSNLNDSDEVSYDIEDSSFDVDEGFGDDVKDQIPYDLAKSLSRRESLIRIVLLGIDQSQTQNQGAELLKSIEVGVCVT